MTSLRYLIGAVLAVCLSLGAVAQQISGSIRGTVVDPTGAALQGASVGATQTETGLTRTSTTDHSGGFVLLELPVGHYRLQVEGKGFQTYIQQGITLDVNETATIPVRLAVGAETQHVDVEADAQLIQATVTSLGKTVSEREVLDLPLNGRNFAQLGLLQPGHCVMCAVTDPSQAAPVPGKPGYFGETSRGLHIVAALSDQWGYVISPEQGKVIWALFA